MTTGQNILCASKHCSMSFVWKGRKCVLISIQTLGLVVYDYFNQQVIDTFQISSLPSYDRIVYIAYLGENNFLICLGKSFLFVLLLENSPGFSAFSFISDFTYPTFYALSPNNLYVACSDGSPILRIMNVDNGETLQTVAPKQKPIVCWWSELYLWVVCKDLVVVKYPYTSTHGNVLENYTEEFSIDCKGYVLKFEEGVLVCSQKNEKIYISKIGPTNVSAQQILDSKLNNSCDVVISSDGCAVLLYDKDDSSYELWEIGSENEWELHSTGKLNPSARRVCLAGKKNSRSLLWLLSAGSAWLEKSALCSLDFSDTTPENVVRQLSIQLYYPDVIYADSQLLICREPGFIHFIDVPDGTVVTSLRVGYIKKSFFVPSKRLLFLLFGDGIMKHFKIHHIDKYLPSK